MSQGARAISLVPLIEILSDTVELRKLSRRDQFALTACGSHLAIRVQVNFDVGLWKHAGTNIPTFNDDMSRRGQRTLNRKEPLSHGRNR